EGRSSGRGHRQIVDHHPDLAAEHVEQDCDPFAVGKTVEQAHATGEDSIDDVDLLADREARPRIEPHETALVLAPSQTVDDVIGDVRRLLAVADEPAHPDGRLNRAPAL